MRFSKFGSFRNMSFPILEILLCPRFKACKEGNDDAFRTAASPSIIVYMFTLCLHYKQ